MTKTFTAESTDTKRKFEFTIINDKIVELDELFDLVITVSDPRVIIERDVGYAVISDDESMLVYLVFNMFSLEFIIGFREIQHTIYEGDNVTLIVEEKQGFIGGQYVSGVPEYQLSGAFLVYFKVDSSATES